MSRYTGIPFKPWQSRPGGGSHPLAGGGTQALTTGVSGAAGLQLSQAAGFSLSQPEASSRAAYSNRPAASIQVPRFAPQPQPRQAPAPAPAPAAHAMRSSQAPLAASQQPATFAPWSQRSHMDNIMLAGAEVGPDQFEEQTVGDNIQMSQMEAVGPPAALALAVGSSLQRHRAEFVSQPHQGASDAFGVAGAGTLGSQEVHRRSEPAKAATKLLEDIARKQAGVALPAFGLEDNAAVGKLSTKLDALEGRQGALEAAVGNLHTDMAAQGVTLQGVSQACDHLSQALKFITSDIKDFSGIEERLQALLAKQLLPLPPPRITGDMATQTSPQAAPEPMPGLRLLPAATAAATQTSPQAAAELATGRLVSVPPAAAAAAQVPSSILRAFNQCRPSSAGTSQQLLPPKPTMLPPASVPCRGLFSTFAPVATAAAASPASGCPLPTKPTTSSPPAKAAPAPVRRSTRLTESQTAAAGLVGQKKQPVSGTAVKAARAAEPSAEPGLSGSSSKQPSSRTKRRTPAQLGAVAAAAPFNGSQPRSAAAPAGPSSAATSPVVLAAPAVHTLKVAPTLASFGRKRSLPAGLETTAGVSPGARQQQQEEGQQPASKRQRTHPVSNQEGQQQQQQQPAGKPQPEQRARRTSKPPQPARKPPAAAFSQQPSQQPSKLRQPASQAEVLFDSLFGDGSGEVEPASLGPAAPSSHTDRDLAAAVQRQLVRHQRRVAKSRQHRPTQLSSES